MSAPSYRVRLSHVPDQPYPWYARVSFGDINEPERTRIKHDMTDWCHDQFDGAAPGWTHGLDGFFFKYEDRACAFKIRWG